LKFSYVRKKIFGLDKSHACWLFIAEYYEDIQTRDDEMDWPYSTHGREINGSYIWNAEGIDRLKDLDVDGRVIKLILKETEW
jgi:hypothetical protein